MDPNPPTGFPNMFNDPDLVANLGKSSSQPAFVHPQFMFPYAHSQFPAFCTQPPPPLVVDSRAAAQGAQDLASTIGFQQIPNPKCQIPSCQFQIPHPKMRMDLCIH
uniref:Uncharacterized protein n=1 Tax=Oryza nivara TaxID=4536 RepID=A0A0E0H9N1_ORYNI